MALFRAGAALENFLKDPQQMEKKKVEIELGTPSFPLCAQQIQPASCWVCDFKANTNSV